MFEAIAIVGRACVLPGANSVEQLWQSVVDCHDLTSSSPAGAWGTRLVRAVGARTTSEPDVVACERGGYVSGFDTLFDPAGFALDRQRIERLDAGFRWLLHCARESLAQARVGSDARRRTGFVLGNLSYPSRAFADYACDTWLASAGRPIPSACPESRFVSGLPVQLTARALGLEGPAFALDAACASSLYAVKLACDLLHDRTCDVVLAGGLNRADNLFLQVGFTALSALSASGRSRPLTHKADGLLPAEGAALVALKRLDDALAAGDRIHAVIRGAGLSNDGRERGLLAPDGKGQIRAMRQAYDVSGITPESVGFVECHATGTTVGDSEEIRSMASLFAAADDLPIGALKANLGHLITASGAAAILKVTQAFEGALLPPTIDAEHQLGLIAKTPLRLLARPEPWHAKGPRRAGINAFGFGGNNAHLILEEPPATRAIQVTVPAPARSVDIAICGIGVTVGDANGLAAVVERLRGPANLPADRQVSSVVLPIKNLRFPPADLRRSLGQQTLAMDVAFQALAGVETLDAMNCGVYFGMGCDAESARWALRWRLADLLEARGLTPGEDLVERLQEEAAPPLNATGVLGTMPNIPANRLSAQFDFRGPAFTVSAEELSGVEALRLACRALGQGEIDAALVGAVDLSLEPVHERALSDLLEGEHREAADGAVAFVLKRLDDARRDGDRVFAVLPARLPHGGPVLEEQRDRTVVRQRFGSPHAAAGLLEVLGSVIEATTRTTIDATGMRPALAAPMHRRRTITCTAFAGQQLSVEMVNGSKPVPILRKNEAVWLRCYGAHSRSDLLRALESGRSVTLEGASCRLAVVARDRAEFEARLAACRAALGEGTMPQGRGIHYHEGPALGEAALVFAGANTYPGMGRDFLLAFPEIGEALVDRFPIAAEIADALYGPSGNAFAAEPFGALKAASLVCQAHALAADRILGLKPAAVLGLSSGETNSLFAFDVWRDMTEMFHSVGSSGLYDVHLAGRFEAARTVWGLDGTAPLDWQSWLISAPVKDTARALQGNERAAISIVLSPGLCIVGGTADGCRMLLDRVGRQRAVQQTPTLICHSTVLEPFASAWAEIHERPTAPAPGLRFYSQAHNAAYPLTRESVRDALLEQARRPIDFAATVERAWQDGVRIFIEAGPRNMLSRAIAETLGARPHLALSLDDGGRPPVEHVATVAARLFAAGAPLSLDSLERFLGQEEGAGGSERAKLALTLPARMPMFDVGSLKSAQPLPTLEVPVDDATVTPLFAVGAPQAMPADLHVFTRGRPPKPAEVHQLVRRTPAEPETLAPPYDRSQLETLTRGRISTVFGSRFRGQDGYARQVRMPMPPLLLADRVVAIDAPAAELGKGRIVTETDIAPDAWYLDEGRMPVGLLIESGQADLLLISWMGIDAINQGDRVYRLLGCEITFHDGGMPGVGDTLRFDIHVDGHAQVGDLRMFFFGYECRIGDRLVSTVRNGQAGFFTDAELAAAKGVNWTPLAPSMEGQGVLPASLRPSSKTTFSDEDVAAFAAGDALACFGAGFEQTGAHQRTPKLPSGRMKMIDRVTRFEPAGGPRGLGYLEAVASVPVDAWFYEGHFLNDPCMPGTLMADAAVQALAFHMSALGFTVSRDAWRFEPVAGEAFKFVCRGQVVPDRPHELRYEVFVEEIVDGPTPMIFATLLCTCDGLKVFHCPRFGLRLVPDWPISTRQQWLDAAEPARFLRSDGDVRGDYEAILACAWGRPSIPFGAHYARFDHEGRVPRLPGPPYLFVSRIRSVSAPAWKLEAGASVVAEYDVPPDAWYFCDNDRPVMPFAVLSEVLLQPCGWLASYVGAAASGKAYFRNLDGSGAVQHVEVAPDAGTLAVSAVLTRLVRLGERTLTFFEVECRAGERLVCRMTTSFGIFTAAELAKQAGLTVKSEARAFLAEAAPSLFTAEDLAELDGPLRLPSGKLRMIDEVTGFWPATADGPGRIRCRRSVSAYDWYFKAHFYEDPVQPGSLGLEALFQSVKAYLIAAGHGRRFAAARFEPIALGQPLIWKYRGQIGTDRREVVTTLSVTVTETPTEVLAVAEGILWADGLPIYEVSNLAVRMVGAPAALHHRIRDFSPRSPGWVADHCPTYTRPALPFMVLAAEAWAAAAQGSGRTVVAIEELQLRRWMTVPADGMRLLTEARATSSSEYQVRVLMCDGKEDRPLRRSAHETALGRVVMDDHFPAAPRAWSPAANQAPVADPYASAALFHGPAFHLQHDLCRGPAGASATVRLPAAGALAADDRLILILDAALHSVPHDEPEQWLGEAVRGMVAFPEQVVWMRFYGALPDSGVLTVETRPVIRDGDDGLLRVQTQLRGQGVLMEMEHLERLRHKGPLGVHAAGLRRRFLAERRFTPGVRLSECKEGATTLSMAAVHRSNWLPGTLEFAYLCEGPLPAVTEAIAVKEHLAERHQVHPAWFDVGDGEATCRLRPFQRFPFAAQRDGATVRVTASDGPGIFVQDVMDRLIGTMKMRPSTATAFHAALVAEAFSAIEIDETAWPLLSGATGVPVEVPPLDGLHGLAVATVLAALSGRPSELGARSNGDEGQILSAVLSRYPMAEHAPLLGLAAAPATQPHGRDDRHRIVTSRGETAGWPGLCIDLIARSGGKPVLRLRRPAEDTGVQGCRLQTAEELWCSVLTTVERETGFVPSKAAACGHDRAWGEALSHWMETRLGVGGQAGLRSPLGA
ncbi:MAG: beta-ketoacyl synthase N-terminal-like domain-containing protein [Pseudomonadota bacterium]